jgi:hypothetical protein
MEGARAILSIGFLLVAACGASESTDVAQEQTSESSPAPGDPAAAVDPAVRREAAVSASGELWLVGGLEETARGVFAPLNVADVVDAEGNVERSVPLPLADDRFLNPAAVFPVDDGLVIIGRNCRVPTDDATCSPLDEAMMPVLVHLDASDSVRVTELPDLRVRDRNGYLASGIFVAGHGRDTAIVTTVTDGRLNAGGAVIANVTIFALDLRTGAVTQVETPNGLVADNAVCSDASSVYALSVIPPETPDGQATALLLAAPVEGTTVGAWRELGPIELDLDISTFELRLNCTPTGEVLVSTGPLVHATYVVTRNGAPIAPEPFPGTAGFLTYLSPTDDGALVTFRTDTDFTVWSLDLDGRPTEVFRSPLRTQRHIPHVIDLDGQLVDVGDADWPGSYEAGQAPQQVVALT